MALGLDEAKRRHGVDIVEGLRHALEAINNRDSLKRAQLANAQPAEAWGRASSHATLGDTSVLLLKALRPFDHAADAEHEDLAAEQEAVETATRHLDSWNEQVDDREYDIEGDDDMDEPTRDRLIGELHEHANAVNIAVWNNAVERISRASEYNKGTAREWALGKAFEWLEQQPIGHEPRLVSLAQLVFHADQHAFFGLEGLAKSRLEEMELDGDELESEEEEGDPELDEEHYKALNFAWNIRRIHESEDVKRFLAREREKAMAEWGVEPFHEAQKVWMEVGERLGEFKRGLQAKGLAKEQLEEAAEKKRLELASAATERIKAMAKGAKSRVVFLGDGRVYRMPEDKAAKAAHLPPILSNGIPQEAHKPRPHAMHYA